MTYSLLVDCNVAWNDEIKKQDFHIYEGSSFFPARKSMLVEHRHPTQILCVKISLTHKTASLIVHAQKRKFLLIN